MDESTLIHHYHQKSIFLSCFHSCYCTFMGLHKDIMTYIYHYDIVQSIFTTHKMPCALCLFIYLPPTTGNQCSFDYFHNFAFSRCHKVRITQYVSFSYWLLSFNNIYLNFLRVFICLYSIFLFSTN